MEFVAAVPVRFADVDWARIIYYPRFLHLLHVAFEEMFERHVGISYAVLLGERNLGFPSVHLECDFKSPMRFGEVLQVATSVTELGTSSVEFLHRVTVKGPEDLRAEARIKRVMVDMQTLRPLPIPEDLRASFVRLRG